VLQGAGRRLLVAVFDLKINRIIIDTAGRAVDVLPRFKVVSPLADGASRECGSRVESRVRDQATGSSHGEWGPHAQPPIWGPSYYPGCEANLAFQHGMRKDNGVCGFVAFARLKLDPRCHLPYVATRAWESTLLMTSVRFVALLSIWHRLPTTSMPDNLTE
jgi:hypothetical protein